MNLRRYSLAMLVLIIGWNGLLRTPAAIAQEPHLTPIVGDVLTAPRPAVGSDGQRHLVYELRMANPTGSPAELKAVDVLDASTGNTLLHLDRDTIAKRFSIGGRRGAESSNLGVGQFGVLFVHVPLPAGTAVPRGLVHRVSARLVQANADFSVRTGVSAVNDPPMIVLGAPLQGKGYIAGDGCCDSIRHVRALLPLNGAFVLAQRFAIDWEQADTENRLVRGDTKNVANYTIYGKDVLAVADGTVVAMRNDLPEQVPGALPKDLPIAEADGNFVVLDIGGGNHVLYAHMQPGSVTVAVGAKVKRGDRLGKVGNTGNSQAPHLHLHVMDGPSPLLSNGVPYVFEHYTLTAIDKAGTADFDKAEATGAPLTLTPVSPPQVQHNTLPLDLSVVDFSR